MKKYITAVVMALTCLCTVHAQSTVEGKCGEDVKWTFDGYTITIINTALEKGYLPMEDYDMTKNQAPWIKKGLNIKKVVIESGIVNIGSCAFAGCEDLTEVVFNSTVVNEIGWGAFLNCIRLRNISLPSELRRIGKVAFANCRLINSVKIPAQCYVEDMAFASCTNLQSIECASTTILGHLVFVNEEKTNGQVKHTLYAGEVRHVPSYVNANNCHEYGFSKASVEKVLASRTSDVDYDEITSKLDTDIPVTNEARNDTYVLIIGNQNYRFVSDVPYAIHDARVFGEYCQKTLGIPANNIHIAEDATKHMILEEELGDWIGAIPNREEKKLIVYYAGHGVPDIKNKNKAFILPTDVRGTHPARGIALDEFYTQIGDFEFAQATVFLDACFSGINRDNEGVTEGLRGVEIEAEEAPLNSGSLVVFSAAQGNETAQGYPDQGHGLFTYYLLNEIRASGGYINYGRLSDNIKENVSQKASELRLRKKQTPSTSVSDKFTEDWRNLKL